MAAENFKVKKGLEVGTAITATSSGVNVTGIVTATQFVGDGSGLTGVTGSGSGVVVKDEGSAVGTAGTINFVGSGVAATLSQGTATVTVNAGGLDNVVEDLTPQLGGNLDLNGKFVNGTGGANITGVVTATTLKGNGDFVDIDVDGRADLDDVVVTGVTTTSAVKFINNARANFGTGNRLQIHSNGTNSYVDYSNALAVRSSGGSSSAISLASNGNITVVNNLDISGNLDVDGQTDLDDLVVSGVGTFSTRIDTNGVSFGTNTTTFAAKFADDARINVGSDNDLKIYHDNGSGLTYIRNDGTGPLDIRSINDINIRDGNDGDLFIECKESEGVKLYYEGNEKLEVTNHGAIVTGVATATSFSGSAAGLTNIPSAQLTGALPALDGSALTNVTGSGSGIIVRHDGSVVGTASSINFSTNLDVSAISAGIVTVTASGSSGVSLSGSTNNTVATVTGANALIGEANLTFNGSTLAVGGSSDVKLLLTGSNNPYIQFQEGTTNKAYIQWSAGGNYLQFGNEEAGEVLRLGDGESGLIWRVGTNNRTVWTSGNDGASSGLDADLLDGQEGSYYTNAANLSGTIAAISGANLTSLNASNLGSGTIPNGRFPATLPATSGANLTALNASEITSGTLPIARIADDAVTFAKMQNVGTGVLIGRNDGGSGDMETLSASEVRTLLNVADGATAGITTEPSNVQVTLNLTSSGSNYRLTGPGQDGTENNPDLYLVRGQRYRITHNAGGAHPLQIRFSSGGTAYTDGVTYSNTGNNTTTTGNNLEINLQHDAPARLYYQCTVHGSMLGNIFVIGGPQEIVGVLTATTFSGSGASLTNLPSGQLTGALPAISGANLTNLPAGQLTGTVADARISTLTASKLTGALPAISGANLTNLPSDTPSNSDIQVAYTVTANGASAYRFAGNGVVSTADNPDLYLIRGQKYRFINNSGGSHPFQIRVSNGGSAYSTGVTNNGASSGNIDFAPTYDSPAQLVYQCTSHGGMVGNIYIFGASGNNKNVGVTTFSGAVTATSFSGSGANLTGLTASQIPNLAASKITSGTFDAARIPTLNQNTTGNAASADTIDVTAASNSANYFVTFVDQAGAGRSLRGDSGIIYNPSSNDLTAGGKIEGITVKATSAVQTGSYSNISSGIHAFTASAGSAVTVDSTAIGSASAIEYTIFVSKSSNIQSQKVLIMDNGTTAYIQEYAVMSNPDLILTFTADVSGGNVRLRATPETGISGSTTIKFTKTVIN